MNEYVFLSECREYGTLTDVYSPLRSFSGSLDPWVGFVGGLKYDETALELYLHGLAAKYPKATVVTGDARGAEKYVQGQATELGLAVYVPPLPEWAKSDYQVADILVRSEVIVLVGKATAARCQAAARIHKRCDEWRDARNRRPLLNVA